PTCGSDPRTSGWRFAEPPCPGAACQPASPAATATRSSSHPVVKHPEQLCASERCHLIDAEILPSTRQNHRLEKPLHISTWRPGRRNRMTPCALTCCDV